MLLGTNWKWKSKSCFLNKPIYFILLSYNIWIKGLYNTCNIRRVWQQFFKKLPRFQRWHIDEILINSYLGSWKWKALLLVFRFTEHPPPPSPHLPPLWAILEGRVHNISTVGKIRVVDHPVGVWEDCNRSVFFQLSSEKAESTEVRFSNCWN